MTCELTERERGKNSIPLSFPSHSNSFPSSDFFPPFSVLSLSLHLSFLFADLPFSVPSSCILSVLLSLLSAPFSINANKMSSRELLFLGSNSERTRFRFFISTFFFFRKLRTYISFHPASLPLSISLSLLFPLLIEQFHLQLTSLTISNSCFKSTWNWSWAPFLPYPSLFSLSLSLSLSSSESLLLSFFSYSLQENFAKHLFLFLAPFSSGSRFNGHFS